MAFIVGKYNHYYGFWLWIAVLMSGCGATQPAPVVEGWQQKAAKLSDYRVQPEDTVYSIAWAYGMDYRDLVRFNHLKDPYHLHVNQRLHMSAPGSTSVVAAPKVLAHHNKTQHPSLSSTQPSHRVENKKPNATVSPQSTKLVMAKDASLSSAKKAAWGWPTQGQIVRKFSISSGNKGIDIGGKLGQKILAAAAGKVVYAGSSMPGYGNLIIIKHNDNELSAYAQNRAILVKEGDAIKAGQIIAEMGHNDANQPILHFEIRKNGKPVDPESYL